MNLGQIVFIFCVFMFLCTRLDQFQSSVTHVKHEQQFHKLLGNQPTIKSLDLNPLNQAYQSSKTLEPVENELHELLGDTNEHNR